MDDSDRRKLPMAAIRDAAVNFMVLVFGLFCTFSRFAVCTQTVLTRGQGRCNTYVRNLSSEFPFAGLAHVRHVRFFTERSALRFAKHENLDLVVSTVRTYDVPVYVPTSYSSTYVTFVVLDADVVPRRRDTTSSRGTPTTWTDRLAHSPRG